RLTVTVGLPGSGKRRTRRPLASRYSVMPSTVVTLTGLLDAAAGAAAFGRASGVEPRLAAGAADWAKAWMANRKPSSARPPLRFEVIGNPPRTAASRRRAGQERNEY